LKRYIAEKEFEAGREKAGRVQAAHEERVAIVGSGPAGLTCAYDLVRQGYRVTVFEAESKSGGLLRYGIPDYRLPKDMLDDEISFVEELGTAIKTDSRVENVESLFDQGYKALFIATGAWQNMKLDVPGEESSGVLYALDFLKQANSNEKVPLGDKVIVIGGGSVAVDAARVAKRQGGAEVHLVCLECRDFASRDRMLAHRMRSTQPRKRVSYCIPVWGYARLSPGMEEQPAWSLWGVHKFGKGMVDSVLSLMKPTYPLLRGILS